jgi:hypothetical protein
MRARALGEPSGKTPLSTPRCKNILIYRISDMTYMLHIPPAKGAFRDRHETRAGRRWPRRRRRAWVAAGRETVSGFQVRDDTTLTASLHGLDGERTPAAEDPVRTCADGKIVWS